MAKKNRLVSEAQLELDYILKNKHLSYLNLDWKEIQQISALPTPLDKRTDRPDVDLVRIIRNPDYFHFTCKYILNKDILQIQAVILQELWNHPFPMLIGSRGSSKSFSLALYCILFGLIHQGCKIAITGAVFRQSKVVFAYIENIWNHAPVLRDMLGGENKNGASKQNDRWEFTLGETLITAWPIGTGDKIRGQRARLTIVDEFASLNPEIYETVIQGFTSVSSSPVDNVKTLAEIETLKNLGLWGEQQQERFAKQKQSNQSIIAGTAYYAFNHFYSYFKRYKGIIESRGDINRLEEVFNGEIPQGFNWKDYCVIRLPIELVPKGFMDEKQIARSKATLHSGIFMMEFASVWCIDSNGFYKRTTIEACVCNDQNKVEKACGIVKFRATIRGVPTGRYVYGVDPASEQDNFSIVVVELHEDHTRIVYCWTCTRERHRQSFKNGTTSEEDFYGFCARKIRELMKAFPCEHIAMDSQGGGVAVMEALHDSKNLQHGELPIWPITADHPFSDHKEREIDHEPGLHIVELVNFSSAQYVSEANHGMRKDLEFKDLLFPLFDPLEITFATESDNREGRVYDTLEDCVMEIEELKDELATIEHTQTAASGRDRWDTPEIKKAGNKKGRMRKDRYSALLMANMAARRMSRIIAAPSYKPVGGFVGQLPKPAGGQLYTGPAWFTQALSSSSYGQSVNRGHKE